MDTATSDIRAVEYTPSSDGDSPVLPELLDQIPEGEEIATVTADGAYDTRRCHTAIIDRQACDHPYPQERAASEAVRSRLSGSPTLWSGLGVLWREITEIGSSSWPK